MSLDKKNMVTLAKAALSAKRSPNSSYSFNGESLRYEELSDTLRQQFKEIAGTYSLYRENKNLVFSIIEEVVDDELPKRVLEQYSQFAETKTFAQGDKPVFIQKRSTASVRRAKQFITKVGLAGIYEVFQLDGRSYEVQTSAFGGAAAIGFEEFLDGRVDFAEVVNIIMEGLDESVYLEIERALKAAVTSLQAVNKHSGAGFNEAAMDRLVSIADSYGQATIYCTLEFASKMIPAEGWVSDGMKDKLWSQGNLGDYKGHRVIILPQSFEDETNSMKVIDPSFAWIIPTGSGEKPVKIAFEGNTIVDEYTNYDRSREIQVYKKMGVGAIITNNICVYEDTSLSREVTI